MTKLLDQVLAGLMQRYQERVPDVERALGSMKNAGLIASIDDIENDHIAFRTMGVPNLGIQSFEKIFLACGYEKRDPYHFAIKKLDAFWYSPPEPKYPRIFISELRVPDLTESVQNVIRSYTDEVTVDPVDTLDLEDATAIDQFLHQPLWRCPTWQDYQLLSEESEYAAWVIYNRYYLNHFTISVHNLPSPYCEIEQFNKLLKDAGIKLNNSGGEIKTSPDGLLLQSSTVAELIDAEFTSAENAEAPESHKIAGSYVEFAERRVLPQFEDLPEDQVQREHRRDGFEAGNADKIFESTFSTQTKRSDS